jgi:hypothetical protein
VRERGCAPRVPPAALARSCESKREELLRTLMSSAKPFSNPCIPRTKATSI